MSYGSDLPVAVSHTKTKSSLELVSPEKDQIVSMKRGTPLSPPSVLPDEEDFPEPTDEHPWTVPQAAKFLGVGPQTVYLWVERKQIPHLRIMGRNIRFLQSDLKPFRASFRLEPEPWPQG